jgi:hypothetical protein
VENSMADKMGRVHLVDTLQRLCLEHRAMQLLLEEGDGIWIGEVGRIVGKSSPQHDAQTRFRAAYESLRSDPPADAFFQQLAAAVQAYLVLTEAK